MKTYYSTSEVADIFKVTTKTIRNWDKEDIFVPENRINDERFYSREQIELKLGKTIESAIDPIVSLNKEDIDSLLWLGKELGEEFSLSKHSGETIRERYQSLYMKIVEKSTEMFRRNKKSAANYIVASPEMSSWFEIATAGYAPEPYKESENEIRLLGTISRRWKLYSTHWLEPGQFLLGVKINGELKKSSDSVAKISVNDWCAILV